MRNPRRTAATASALMIGVALVGSITSFAASGKHSVTASFDQEFRGDLVVESGAWMFGGVSPELTTALKARAGGRRRRAPTVHPGPGRRQLG